MSAVLAIEGLTTGYGELTAVREVSLAIEPGEVVALFGPNGAGKTSLLLGAVGALARWSGTVSWEGAPAPRALHQLIARGLAFVPDERSVISSLSARDNLLLGRGGVEAALGYFPELAEHLHRPAGLLSGGQQQILTLARALAAKPKALLVDELSLGLAPQVVERLLATLREAADREGLAVLLVEQQIRRALAVSDRFYLLNHGRIVADGVAHKDGGADLEEAYLESMGISPGTG